MHCVYSPSAEHSRSNDGGDPMDPGEQRPAENKEANGHEDGSADDRGQTELGLATAFTTRFYLQPGDEALADALPDRFAHGGDGHAHNQAVEGEADLPQIEAVRVGEDEGEGAEKDIEHAQQDGGQDAEVENHHLVEK